MRRLLAMMAAIASSGLLIALPATPAFADSASGEASGGGGSYTVKVTISGTGAGSGGSLKGPAVSSGGGGAVYVPSPCGYAAETTQEAIEAAYGGDKAAFEAAYGAYGGPGYDVEGFEISKVYARGIISNWGNTGTWYLPRCDGTGKLAKFGAENPPQLVGGGAAAGPPEALLDPAVLEDIAERAMTLPSSEIDYNPKSGRDARSFVNLPGGTWFWVTPTDNKAPLKVGGDRSVTASAGGRSVTVTAKIDSITITTTGPAKNGSRVSCPDGGTAYTQGAPSTASDCVLEYFRSSGAGAFSVTSAVAWSATSSLGNNLAGAVRRDSISLRIAEIQTINR